jgi:signal peptidase II
MAVDVTGETPLRKDPRHASRWISLSLVAAAVFAIDQATKEIVRSTFAPGEGVHAFGTYSIQHFRNEGVAGGALEGNALPLAVLSLMAVILLYEFLAMRGTARVWLVLGFGLLVGGGLGNLVDRARLGSVTDFIRNGDRAFNIADMAIFVGGWIVLIGLFASLRHIRSLAGSRARI